MLRKAIFAGALALLSAAAVAGLSQPAPVIVDLENRTASGDMLTAVTDKAENVFIGCGTRNYDDGNGGVFTFGFCQAEDADGEHIVCATLNPDLVQAVRAISDFSYIQFLWEDDGNGVASCTSIGISTQSFYIEKPKSK